MPKQTPLDISLDRFADALEQAARKDIPDILGQAAVDAFKQNFQDEGFFGSGWKEVKRRQGHAKGAAASRPILTGNTGNLGRSISDDNIETSDYKASIFSIPLLIVDFALLCARLRGLDIYAYTADHPLFQALLFLGTAALSTALAVWYYRRYRHLLHRMMQDLGQYDDLQ